MGSSSDAEREEDVVPGSGSDSGSDREEGAVSGSESNLDTELDSKSHRGPTIKAKANKKIVVSYNKRGVPTGSGARKLATFEGLVARSMVLITYDSWLNVDKETKEACWEYVRTHFKLHSKSRKQVLQSIGIKWKNFKHYLYKKYVKPLKDDNSKEGKKQLYTSPAKYPSVKKKDWKLFVSQKTKASFEEISKKASVNRSRNQYNHRLSRKGYSRLISEIMQQTGKEEEEIDRAECWKKAREKKKGGFDPAVQKVVDKIEMLKKEKDYSEDPLGSLDLLTEALGTDEQRGRVRGMGRYVTPQQYYLIPRNVKQYLKQYDKIMNKRLKAVEDELERRRCASTNASEGSSNYQRWSDEDEEPNVPSEPIDKSCYLAVDQPSNIVAKGTIVNHTVSDGNIEVKVDTSVQAEALIPIPLPEEFVETVKDAIGYMLSWPSHLVIPCSGLNKIVAKKKAADQEKEKRRKEEKEQRKEKQRKEQQRIEEEGKRRKEEERKEEERTEEERKEEEDEFELDSENHKKRQREPDNEEEAPMPKTVAVEKGKSIETVASIAKVTKKGTALKKMMTRGQKRVRKRIEGRTGLRMTAMMVDGQVAKVDCIKMQCEDDLFGHPSYTYLNWNDFDRLFAMDELSGAVVESYIMYLYEQIKNGGSQRDHGICFMTPTAIMHHERKARAKNIEDASRRIAARLSTRKQNDIVLLPYNPGRHWVLGVLNMKTSTCYYLDSLSTSDVNLQFKQILDAAIALYDVEDGTNKRTKLKWVNSKCPRQPGGTECGYFMLKFMKEVVLHGVRPLENDNIGGDSNEYTDEDFDDIREEWAIYVSNFIFRV